MAFRERRMTVARGLVISAGEIRARRELADVMTIVDWPATPARTRDQRQACFDASVYDRLRVLATELHRVRDEGGEVACASGHEFALIAWRVYAHHLISSTRV